MESLLPLLLAEKLTTVAPVAMIVMGFGAAVSTIGWLWVSYQNTRFSIVNGILSFLIPLWGLLYGFFRMEHKYKTAFLSLFVGGIAVAGLGNVLYNANQICEADLDCMKHDMSIGEGDEEGEEEGDDSGDESSLIEFTRMYLGSAS